MLLITAALIGAAATPAVAGPITVTKTWVRPVPKGLTTSAAYFTVTNTGAADVLEGVSTPLARASVHMSMTHGGMMMMHPQAATPVPAGATVVFQPGGLHVMLEQVKAPLSPGQRAPLTLSFRRAGKVIVDAQVRTTAP